LTAESNLFVTEYLYEQIGAMMNEEFLGIGENYSVEIPDNWRDINREGDFPEDGVAKVFVHTKVGETENGYNITDEIYIADISWETEFYVGGFRTKKVKAKPKNWEIVEKHIDRPAWLSIAMSL